MDRVVVSFPPLTAFAALGALRTLAVALTPSLPHQEAIDLLEKSIERRRTRLTTTPRQEHHDP